MVILILERVPAGLRGELSRWMIEPRAGVFVGRLSAEVRDRLWTRARDKSRGGAGMLVHTFNNEQGFLIQSFGVSSRIVSNWEGLSLITVAEET